MFYLFVSGCIYLTHFLQSVNAHILTIALAYIFSQIKGYA